MLAVKAGLRAGFRRFLLYGALDGPRLDHTVANFQLLHYLTDQDAHGYLVAALIWPPSWPRGSSGFPRRPEAFSLYFAPERTLPESPSGACSTPWRMPCSPPDFPWV